ncbi:MAG TPA: hypothetical protein VFF19_13420 [Reyranella sp.]|jgi:hypothetical protein|nr:hypothetical protein [Reyranella sp.]
MMSKRTWRGLLAVSTFALLAGCGWFGGGDAPTGKARPGADRQIAPTGTLPSARPGGQSEQGVVPTDETRNPIGSVVSTKGGQRAQKEAADKAAADRDAKERELRNAADRDAKQQSAPSQTTPTESPPATTPEPAPGAPKS